MTRSSPADRVATPSGRAASGLVLVLLLGSVAAIADDATPAAPAAAPAAPVAPAPPILPPDAAPPVTPPPPTAPDVRAPASPGPGQDFETPEAAAAALLLAFEKNDDDALRAIMGTGGLDVVQDGKDPIVETTRAAVAAAAKVKLSLEKQADGHVVIVVGRTEYPLAIPLVAKDGRWRADAAAGRQELLARLIGEHELEAVGVCLAYADAQVAYASKDRNGDGVKEYAQRLVSTPGSYDGLYWDSTADEEPSPAGPGLTPLREALTTAAAPAAPFNGYFWRILTSQGSHAPGGAYSYVINGRMIAGFALLAVPATHRNTGVMSFLVSNQGKVYEKDLGSGTLETAVSIDAFDPDASWHEVDEATLRAASETSPEDTPFTDKSNASQAPGDAIPAPFAAQPSSLPTPKPAPATTTPSTKPCPTR